MMSFGTIGSPAELLVNNAEFRDRVSSHIFAQRAKEKAASKSRSPQQTQQVPTPAPATASASPRRAGNAGEAAKKKLLGA